MRGADLCAVLLGGVLCWSGMTMSCSAAEREISFDDPILPDGSIEPERLSALMRRAAEAAQMLVEKRSPSSEGRGTNNLLRIDLAVKGAAANLLLFRNMLVKNGLPGAKQPIDWPQWIFEPPTDKTPVPVLKARIDWLGEYVGPITDPVCEMAKEQTDDPLICSVE